MRVCPGGPDRDSPDGPRVLLVDDDPETLEGLRRLLNLHGFEVRAMADGVSAMALAPDFRPGAVVLDIGLPTVNGCEVARQLRGMPETADALIVAVTGYSPEPESEHATVFDHHLVKPI